MRTSFTKSVVSLLIGLAAALPLATVSSPALARGVKQPMLARNGYNFHRLSQGTAIPLLCNEDDNSQVSFNFVNVGRQLILQLNDAGDSGSLDFPDIVGMYIDGFAGQPLGTVQVDFSGPCLPPTTEAAAEGPNIFVLGNDALGNGVLAIANCGLPSKAVPLSNGFLQEIFLANDFETFQTTNPTGELLPCVKIVGMDIETSGLSAPVYVKGILVNGIRVNFDTNPSDTIGCLPVSASF